MSLNPRKVLPFAVCITWAILLFPSHSHAFATPSHRYINLFAAKSTPALNDYLMDTLGFLSGLDTTVKNSLGVSQAIIDWIGRGGEAEDQLLFRNWWGELLGGMTRSRRHFHQPLRPWDQAGLKGMDDSSIYWAQDRNQSPGRKASWFDGRDSYLASLLAPTEQKREESFAETFQTLGQVMHLVADSASVPHARDDVHVFGRTFEDFVAENPDLIRGIIDFEKSILQQPTGDDRAPVPIARLWDTNIYSGTNPPVDSDQQIGLAEFTNANFFSEDTISQKAFKNTEFPLPALDRLVLELIETDPRTGKQARYLSKIGDGVGITHMVRVSPLFDFAPYVSHTLDDRVYQDYASYLLPRAVGYSAGILDYFFRGKIKIEAPARFAYALAAYQEGNTGSFTKMRLKVSNDTDYPNTNENTLGPGQMWAVVRYRKPLSGNLFENPFANLSDPYYAVSAPQNVDLSRDPQELVFDFTGTNSIPTNSADVFLWVVWQGKLGQEDGAIMVGGKDLLEPNPLTFGNGTDYDCFNQSLYHVADLGAFPPYNSTHTQRDVSRDGVQDLFGAFIDYGQFIKTYDLSVPQVASPTLFDFKVSQQQAAPTGPQYSRFVILQDQSDYAFSWRISNSIEVPSGNTDTTPRNYAFQVYGNVNDFFVDPSTGALTRRVTSNMLYRGVPTFSMYISVFEGLSRYGPCVSASFLLPEPFTRIEGELAPEQ